MYTVYIVLHKDSLNKKNYYASNKNKYDAVSLHLSLTKVFFQYNSLKLLFSLINMYCSKEYKIQLVVQENTSNNISETTITVVAEHIYNKKYTNQLMCSESNFFSSKFIY